MLTEVDLPTGKALRTMYKQKFSKPTKNTKPIANEAYQILNGLRDHYIHFG